MDLESYMFRALNAQIGVKILTSNPVQLRAKLYPIRKNNIGFESLSFVVSPHNPDGELWIIKKEGKPDGKKSNSQSGEEDA